MTPLARGRSDNFFRFSNQTLDEKISKFFKIALLRNGPKNGEKSMFLTRKTLFSQACLQIFYTVTAIPFFQEAFCIFIRHRRKIDTEKRLQTLVISSEILRF